MSNISKSIQNTDKSISETIKILVEYCFEMKFPHKLTKWRGKKIVPLYEWSFLRKKEIDKIFDYIPEEDTWDTPKFYCLEPYQEDKLRVWYADFNAYLERLGVAPHELKFFDSCRNPIEDPSKKQK